MKMHLIVNDLISILLHVKYLVYRLENIVIPHAILGFVMNEIITYGLIVNLSQVSFVDPPSLSPQEIDNWWERLDSIDNR